jgi:hypothetical protein
MEREAAGHLAAFCAARRVPPRAVWERPALLAAFQRELDAAGIEREWRLESAAGAGYAGAR